MRRTLTLSVIRSYGIGKLRLSTRRVRTLGHNEMMCLESEHDRMHRHTWHRFISELARRQSVGMPRTRENAQQRRNRSRFYLSLSRD